MARSVYLTGLEPGGGKSAVAVGVAELLSRRVSRLAVFRPLVRQVDDPILELLRLRYQSPPSIGFGATYIEAARLVSAGGQERLVAEVLERFRAQTAGAEAIVIVGTDFGRETGNSGLHEELAFNARLASEFDAVVLPVIDGRGRDVAGVRAALRSARQSLTELGTTVVALVANRVARSDAAAIAAPPHPDVPVYAIPDDPMISAPTFGEVVDRLGAKRLLGEPHVYGRDVRHFVVGAANVPLFLDHLDDGCAVITPGDRMDLLTATFASHASGATSVAGIILTLGEAPDPRVLNLVAKLRTDLPVALVDADSFATVASAANLEGRLSAADPAKIERAVAAFESNVDTKELARLLDVARSGRVTPLMFEYALLDRARQQRRHVVLPEGTEERILRAADVLLRRGVAELTLLGRPDEIVRRARELGLDISAANLVDPITSGWREEFASAYADLRSHKGTSFEMAYDTVGEVNYFGTMMVAAGRADAMVSGAVHPTADTIRPAFEIIKTLPGLSVASSVFFMCLADQVLVYGDCAVNPDPDARALADIALSSAQTAASFGITPRLAMLSYSTGSSGHGADVEKVVEATRLVRERRPELPIEGPIQYDAAVDESVAQTKLPGSEVAGRATVLIFPDLNTGNNTYKAVQRSAGAVAVGPVLQGLRRPINDLSRGATVADIVNTVVITAIQAQATPSGTPL